MEERVSRRKFVEKLLIGLSAVGLGGAFYPLIRSLSPLGKSLATARVEVDISNMNDFDVKVVSWKGKTTFVVKLPQNYHWKGPSREEENLKKLKGKRVFALIGICTHLGCIPLWRKEGDEDLNQPHFHCPCHGGTYTPYGDVIGGPPPKPLAIPPQKLVDGKLIIGG